MRNLLGHKSNGHGGPRPGSGRKPNWLKSLCDDILWQNQLAEQMGDIAIGKTIAIKYTDPETKKVVTVTRVPTLADMQWATEWLADRAHGKPRLGVDHSGTLQTVSALTLTNKSAEERGLPE